MSNPKSKTQKKIDNNIRVVLTAVCEETLGKLEGFEWLTHQANYTNFPASLLITCVFRTDQQLEDAVERGDTQRLQRSIQAQLLKVGIKFKYLAKQIIFDTEERCEDEDGADWSRRLERRAGREIAKNRPQ